VELEIGGMTCASCAARVERKLNRLDGVQASVNFALERARVDFPERVSVADLIRTVEATGYSAMAPAPAPAATPRSTAVDLAAPGAADAAALDAAARDAAARDAAARDAAALDAAALDAAAVDTALDAGTVDTDEEAAAGDGAARDAERPVRRRLLVAALLSVPVLALAMVTPVQFPGWQWVVFALATPVVTWAAWPFHRAAWINLRHRSSTMDTLISLGAVVSYGWSVWALSAGTEPYFEVGAALTTFLLAGRYFEARAKRRAGSALRALLEMGAKTAAVLRDGAEVQVPIEALRVGDVFVVRPGEKVATDGVVVAGSSALDASLLTGESVPVEVGPGDSVVGATINAGGRLLVRAGRVGADTQLAQMARLVSAAQSGKAPVQRLADRAAAVFVPTVLVLAALTLAGWLAFGGGAVAALTAGVAVLIVACPCALGLATPVALLVGTGRGAQLGILVRGPQVLEATRRVDTVVLDKTGTVTTGRMALLRVDPADGVDGDELLRHAAAVEHAAEHPIARAIAAAGPAVPADAIGFAALPGLGAEATVDGRRVVVGRPALLSSRGIEVPQLPADHAGTVVAVAWDGVFRGTLTVADTVRPTSAVAVARLRGLGLEPVLLTGDSAAVARTVAAGVGIGEVVAEVLPADKVDVVRRLQERGRVVAMVGDGVNDAAALATADLGIAIGTGADVAIEASDLTLMRGDLTAAADAILLSRATLRTIRGNLFWAFAYNVAAIPLAAAGLVTPVLAAAAMAASSVFVLANSLRLFRFQAGR
jgi:Cu+-exporting ATPase